MEINLHIEPQTITINEQKGIVVVVFKDGSKQIVRCSPEDNFDPEIGFALAVARNLAGSKTRLNKYLNRKARFIEPKNKENRQAFLKTFLQQNELTEEIAAQLCNTNLKTFKRAIDGRYIQIRSFKKIAEGLGFTSEQARLFRNELGRRYRWKSK